MDEGEVDQDLVELERLQEIAKAKREEWDSATTEESRHTLINEVLVATVQLVNHEAGVPGRRRAAQTREIARKWRRLARRCLVVLLATALVTVIGPWVSAWWLLLPLVLLGGLGMLVNHSTADRVSVSDARAVEIGYVIAVVVGVLTTLLAPVLPGTVLAVGSVVTLLAVGSAVMLIFGPSAITAQSREEQ